MAFVLSTDWNLWTDCIEDMLKSQRFKLASIKKRSYLTKWMALYQKTHDIVCFFSVTFLSMDETACTGLEYR